MNLLSKLSIALALLFTFSMSKAQMKHAKTEKVKIYGNCDMCEKTIETAGNVKKIAKVDWNKDSKMATITYDSSKTNQEEILKRIALAGYDSDKFLAPNDVYAKLPGCCQYTRENNATVSLTKGFEALPEKQAEEKVEVNQLKTIFENYFAVKDALVKSDGKLAATLAKDLLKNSNAVKMDKLSTEEHTVWMKVLSQLKSTTDKISATTSVEKQRIIFMDLSENFYALLKVSKQDMPIYYQNCPMYNDGKGANWLSKEAAINNPYYGAQMLSCGKTIETIK